MAWINDAEENTKESLKNSDFPPAQGWAGKIDRAKRLIL